MRPYAFLHERERSGSGAVESFATIFLTNRECPYRCLMCDLWKNTTEERVPIGAIPEQIQFALSLLPPADHIKLYNSGNFFDSQAIPPEDYEAIAELLGSFQTVVVENHPRLTDERVLRFRELINGRLQVAMGLETIHPKILPSLNKQMTVDDFDSSVKFLLSHRIEVRTFVLLKPPGLSEQEGIDWAVRSADHAFERGVECVTIIPVRSGNGTIDDLIEKGEFSEPELCSLETAASRSIALPNRKTDQRVFVDLWDVRRFSKCDRCIAARISRLDRMNMEQIVFPEICCDCN